MISILSIITGAATASWQLSAGRYEVLDIRCTIMEGLRDSVLEYVNAKERATGMYGA
jgi:hypothetical protein